MFATFALTALLASASLLRVRADVTPSDPGPGVVYKVGGSCHVGWIGDENSPTAWKNMAIQLMTGDNLNMIHLTTVATGLDGTIDGTFDHPCPSVSPNSAIYFYQFTAPNAPKKQWTTRFTIASAAGATTPPTNNTQPGGAAIPWGTGALTDPSTAVPPPSFVASSSGDPFPAPTSILTLAPLSSSTPPAGPPTILSSSSVVLSTSVPAVAGLTTVRPSSAGAATPSVSVSANSTANVQDNAAGSVVVNSLVWQAVMGLSASTIAFVVLL